MSKLTEEQHRIALEIFKEMIDVSDVDDSYRFLNRCKNFSLTAEQRMKAAGLEWEDIKGVGLEYERAKTARVVLECILICIGMILFCKYGLPFILNF